MQVDVRQGGLAGFGRGWAGLGTLNREGGKPKWMRWRTFERLAAEGQMALRFGINLGTPTKCGGNYGGI